jgi:cytosine/adenosine deaminase-related metal-dependent hydrolase
MPEEFDLVVRDGYVRRRNAVVDVAVRDGTIVRIAESVDAGGAAEIDAGGTLVSPGFVDCHKHVDRAFAAAGDRRPRGTDDPFPSRGINDRFDRYYEDTSVAEVEANAVRDVEMAVAAGSTHVRSHVGVDHTIGTGTMEACVGAKRRTDHLVDLQLVPAAYGGILHGDGERRVREAVEMGLEAFDRDAILVGGTDPATTNGDVEGAIDAWFDVATDYDVDMDVHIQDGGTLGLHTLETLFRKTREYDYAGRVTASHCFSLAGAPDWWLDELIGEFTDLDLDAVTCYNSVRCEMPVRELVDRGVTLGHGTDNDRDFVIPHGNADSLEGAQVMSLKLHGNRRSSEAYRWFESNPGLELLWDLLTTQGADVLGVGEAYGVREGASADLVVLDSPSPQWAIIDRATRSHVVKDGTVVARDGDVLPEARAGAS